MIKEPPSLSATWTLQGGAIRDITVRRGNFTFYFPVVTSILLSILLTVILWLFQRR